MGRSFLQQGSAVLDFANNVVTFNQMIEIPMHQVNKNASIARLTQSHCVPGNSEIICYVSCHSRFNDTDVLLTPIPGKQFGAYAVANTCSSVKNKLTLCRILNFNDSPLVLCKDQKMGQVQEFVNDQNCMSISQKSVDKTDIKEGDVSEHKLEQFAKEYNFNINAELTNEVRLQTLKVLYKNKAAFARTISDLKVYNKELFEIKLKDTSPMIQKQFPLKEEHAKILDSHISDWLKDDIIEPSRSYFYNNPIFLVAKQSLKDATNKLDPKHFRPVLDCRGINLRLEPFVVYTPSPNELLDKIAKFTKENGEESESRACWFSTTDIHSAFLQLGLKPGISRSCLSFQSPSGDKYCMKRVPFGLRTSSAYFLTVLNRVLAPMRHTAGLSFYCDDIILYTSSISSHLTLLNNMLSLLIQNDLKCSVTKSYFLYTSINYLGRIISKEGISIPKTINRTLDKMQSMNINTRRKLLSVLGFLQYWRSHISNLASRTYHMRLLTQKDAIFKWDENCQKELDDVINALRVADPLQAINPFKPVYIAIDSSYRGIGMSICQSTEQFDTKKDIEKQIKSFKNGCPTIKPIWHVSFALNSAQRSYSSTTLEIFGLTKALSSVSYLLKTTEIHVLSDNLGVCSFSNKLSCKNSRQRRCMAMLQNYNLTLHFVSGVNMGSADMLSRLPGFLTPGETVNWGPPDDSEFDDLLFNVSNNKSICYENTQIDENAACQQINGMTQFVSDNRVSKGLSKCRSTISDTADVVNPSASRSVARSAIRHVRPTAMPDLCGMSQELPHNHKSVTAPTRVQSLSRTDVQCTCLHQDSVQREQTDQIAPEGNVVYTDTSTQTTELQQIRYPDHQMTRAPSTVLDGQGSTLASTHAPVAPSITDVKHLSTPNALSCAVTRKQSGITTNQSTDTETTHDLPLTTAISDSLDATIVQDDQSRPNSSTPPNCVVDTPTQRDTPMHAPPITTEQVIDAEDAATNDDDIISSQQGQLQAQMDNMTITGNDYASDPNFGLIWDYLTTDKLTGKKDSDYRTTLLASLYVVENDQLFRICLPQSRKRLQFAGECRKLLVIPKSHENHILVNMHNFAHSAGAKLFELCRHYVHMHKLYESCFQVARSCKLCAQCNINRNRETAHLTANPIYAPGSAWVIDHKSLPRTTKSGATAILAMIDLFFFKSLSRVSARHKSDHNSQGNYTKNYA